MASKRDVSHDSNELHGNSDELHRDSDGGRVSTQELLQTICKQLTRRTTQEIVAVCLKPDTQNMVSSQLLPLNFEPHGLTTPISVIVGLLVHCFLLNRELEGVKGRDAGELAALQEDVKVLKELYEGVVHVNQQWAVDYDKLQEQVASSTGITSSPASRRHSDVLMSPSSERCFECFMNKGRQSAGGDCEALRGELQEVKTRLEAIKRERDRAVDENRAIQFQLQELGDLRQAMILKEEYPKKLSELKSVHRQHQDEVCARIKLEKQIERLRHVFTDLFPVPTESGRGHSTYPPHLRPCHAQQAFYSDPGPPTPPGLIARGHLTSLVERDIQSLSQQYPKRRDEQVTVRLSSTGGQLSRQQERWASDPHLNIVNGTSLAPPKLMPPLRQSRSLTKGRPRSLFLEKGEMARSLCDVRTVEESTNHIAAPPEFEGGQCPVCGETLHRSDLFFDHVKMCGT